MAWLTNNTLLALRFADGTTAGDRALKLLPWFSDDDHAIQCMSLSANGRNLGVLCAAGGVFIVPVGKVLDSHHSKLYTAHVTPSGLPSMAALLEKRQKSRGKDSKWV